MRPFYSAEELQNKKIIVVTNLKPARLKGELSEGMLLAGQEDENTVGLLTVERAEPGEQVTLEGVNPEPIPELDYKIFAKVKLVVGENGVVLHGNRKLMAGSEKVKVERVKEGSKIL
jgi:methionyl-tRNA synthetase